MISHVNFSQLINIAKLMIHDEVQQAREFEAKLSNSGDKFVTSTIQGNQGQTKIVLIFFFRLV